MESICLLRKKNIYTSNDIQLKAIRVKLYSLSVWINMQKKKKINENRLRINFLSMPFFPKKLSNSIVKIINLNLIKCPFLS